MTGIESKHGRASDAAWPATIASPLYEAYVLGRRPYRVTHDTSTTYSSYKQILCHDGGWAIRGRGAV